MLARKHAHAHTQTHTRVELQRPHTGTQPPSCWETSAPIRKSVE